MPVLNGTKIITVEWVNLAITLALVCFRQYLRLIFRKRFTLCDGFVVLAWLSFLLQGCIDTIIWRLGIFEGKISHTATNLGPEHGLATYRDTVKALRLVYVETITYYNCMYCVKWSMLAFYETLIPHHMARLRFALWTTVVLTVVGFISTFFVKLFICMPIWENYTPGTRNCDPANSSTATIVRWTQHVVTDILVYLLPLFLLRTLQLKRSQKIGISATFVVGFICIFFACAENFAIWLEADYATIWFFADLEQTWAVIVVCCPALRALYNLRDRKKRSESHSISTGLRERSTRSRNRHLDTRKNLSETNGARRLTSDDKEEDPEGGIKMDENITVTYEITYSRNNSAASADDDDELKLMPVGKVTSVAYAT